MDGQNYIDAALGWQFAHLLDGEISGRGSYMHAQIFCNMGAARLFATCGTSFGKAATASWWWPLPCMLCKVVCLFAIPAFGRAKFYDAASG